MPGRWDDIMKLLVRYDPQQFVSWLLKDGVFVEELPVEIKRRDIFADALYKVMLNGEPILLEIEFQSTNQKLMPERLLEYNIQASRAYKVEDGHLPVLTCVIYLFDDGEVPQPPFVKTLPNGYEVLRFNYICIELSKLPTEEILQKGLIGLYPLLPLTTDGKHFDVVDKMIEGIASTGDKELLTLAYTLTALVFSDPDNQKRLKRRFAMLGEDILEKSWAYQEIKQKGRDEGLKEGLNEGLKQGLQQGLQQGLNEGLKEGLKRGRQQECQTLRQVLIDSIRVQYPGLVVLATKKTQEINEPAMLQDIILKLLTARNEDEVQHILLAIDSENE